MQARELTKAQIELMSDVELNFWYQKLQQEIQTEKMKKELCSYIEMQGVKE